MSPTILENDGFFFIPDNQSNFDIHHFRFTENENHELLTGIEGTEVGPKFHIAFFKEGTNGKIEFDESFEAIFADPYIYLKNLIGMNIFGVMVRKTEKSTEWFDEYLTMMKGKIDEQ